MMKNIKWFIAGTGILLSLALSGQGFRAAVVKIDITPSDSQFLLGYQDRKSTGILDHIFQRILALDDGKTQFFLVSTDVCEFSPSVYDEVAKKLERQMGIKPQNFLWVTTHTHSAPEVGPAGLGVVFLGERYKHEIDPNYTAMIERTLIEGIGEARQKLSPARLGVGWGFSMANINRRAIDVDGQATLGLNPDGPTDRRIGLIRIDREDGKPLALIANYPIHGTVMGGDNTLISGDAPGVVSEYVEQKIGAPVLFINGALGNLAPIYSVYRDAESGHLGQFRVLLGDRILEANQKIFTTKSNVTLITGSLVLETPRKSGLGWSPDLENYTKTSKSGINMVELPIRFLRINDDVAIWSGPLELFCEVSNEIRDRSPFPYTFYFGLGNGSLGYMVTEPEYKHGGYEPSVSPFTPAAARELTESVVGYLQGELKSRDINNTK